MKVAIITGASSGLGVDFAKEIDKINEVEQIWLVARRRHLLEKLSNELKIKSQIIEADLSQSTSIESILEKIQKEEVEVQILINNAGFGALGDIESLDKNLQLNMIDLNVRALVDLTITCLPFMKRDARIIQIASSAGFSPIAKMGTYSATKAFVIFFSKALSLELKDRGVKVTTVCPGPIKTEFFQSVGFQEPKYFLANSIDVVKIALRDSERGRFYSIYGLPIKMYKLIYPWVPSKLVAIASNFMKKRNDS